jgi:hypothetical protein
MTNGDRMLRMKRIKGQEQPRTNADNTNSTASVLSSVASAASDDPRHRCILARFAIDFPKGRLPETLPMFFVQIDAGSAQCSLTIVLQ